ncbi:MAG: type I restriction enzyme HsdR N-terminal domain-containing protein [Desulfobacterales bacterium]|nr:type I restriction enzyme HsdR N-terminal domain-containing protein [Desulfobacterales bacterium]
MATHRLGVERFNKALKETQGHHLVLGELIDFVTGERIPDTHDERYRQQLARLLVEHKGYLKNQIQPRFELRIAAENKQAILKIDFVVHLFERICMILKYGPGSLVTRHRSALAASRLVAPYQVPIAVVTNGKDADIIEGATGNIISSGLESIPVKAALVQRVEKTDFDKISAKQAEMESRILYAFEVDGSCPCDDTICIL